MKSLLLQRIQKVLSFLDGQEAVSPNDRSKKVLALRLDDFSVARKPSSYGL